MSIIETINEPNHLARVCCRLASLAPPLISPAPYFNYPTLYLALCHAAATVLILFAPVGRCRAVVRVKILDEQNFLHITVTLCLAFLSNTSTFVARSVSFGKSSLETGILYI